MSDVLVMIAGAVASVLVIIAIVRISMRITDRKPTEELKRARPDASSINQDSGMAS
jgi:flagellar biosynthesis/type III secretory pathway M-ring protein FliF/YscJ